MTIDRNFQITPADSRDFGSLSGDTNPIHLDPSTGRRSFFGGTVVHGIHCLLKVLDQWAAECSRPFRLSSLRADFHGAVPTGSPVHWILAASGGGKVTVYVRGPYGLVQHVRLRSEDLAEVPESPGFEHFQAPSAPVELTFDQAQGKAGVVRLQLEPGLASHLFPNLTRWMSQTDLAYLLASTKVVGMECPGRQSLFTGMSVEFAGVSTGRVLNYAVTDADDRFQSVTIELESPGMKGHLNALFRPMALEQEKFSSVRSRIEPGQFAGQRALVIGGSRGLGELAAKMIAAGGGTVFITYAAGQQEAVKLAAEIGESAARTLSFNVLDPPTGEPPFAQAPTHLYYFATPHIVLNKSGSFDSALFEHFQDFYVQGFERTVSLVRSWWPDAPLVAYYPSSVFVEEVETGAAEYAAAKGAGEVLCRYLNQTRKNLRVAYKRLPRVRTDQTNAPGLDPTAFPDSLSVLLGWMVEDVSWRA